MISELTRQVCASKRGIGECTIDELMAVQRDYDALVAWFGSSDIVFVDRQSAGAMALHQHIMRVLRGEVPDPRHE